MNDNLTYISLRKTIVSLLGLLFITGCILAILKYVELDQLRAIVSKGGLWSPLVYVIIKIITYVIAPLSGAPLLVASGTVFGTIEGTIYSLCGDTIGASLNYWISKSFGRPIMIKFIGTKGIAKVDSFIHKIGGWRTLLFFRLFLFYIYDFVSYSVGLTQINFRLFLIISFFGGIIPTLLNVSLGDSLAKDTISIVVVYLTLLGFFLIPILLKKYILKVR